jgi:hypothetical protein
MAAGPLHLSLLPWLPAGQRRCCCPSPSSSRNQTSCWSRCCWIQTRSYSKHTMG